MRRKILCTIPDNLMNQNSAVQIMNYFTIDRKMNSEIRSISGIDYQQRNKQRIKQQGISSLELLIPCSCFIYIFKSYIYLTFMTEKEIQKFSML